MLFVTSCVKSEKPKINEENNNETPPIVSVRKSRLYFPNGVEVKKYLRVLNKSVGFENVLMKELKKEGFVSSSDNKAQRTGSGMKTLQECSGTSPIPAECEILDSYNMMDVGNWTIKVNFLTQKFYLLYKPFFDSTTLATRLADLEQCNFTQHAGLFERSLDYEALNELEVLEDSLNGVPETARVKRCGVACADRSDTKQKEGPFDNIVTTTWKNGNPYNAFIPNYVLEYNRGLIKGIIRVYIDYLNGEPNVPGAYLIVNGGSSLASSSFKKGCNDPHTIPFGVIASLNTPGSCNYCSEATNNTPKAPTPINISPTCVKFIIYSDDRIKAGTGDCRVKLKLNDPNNPQVQSSTDALIVF